jgi:uncharacterized integral membrane protein
MLTAIVFLLSLALGISFVARARMAVAWKGILGATVILLLITAYIFADQSQVSPFGSPTGLGFGFWDKSLPVAIGIVGAVLGVFGSHLFTQTADVLDWRGLTKALVASPILIIPTIKLVEATGEQNLLTMMLLFGISYQNGFFWERVLEQKRS